jgi:hypothetical protein
MVPAGPPGLSNYIMGYRPDCCGPVGGNGPILYELYARTGPSLPIEGAIFGHVLETGWAFQGGARSMLFNPEMNRAWAIDLGISDIYNRGQRSDIKIPFVQLFNIPPVSVTQRVSIRELNRTFVNLSFGREWWMATPLPIWNARWRIGVDAGGSLGSAKIEFNEIQHRTDVVGAIFVALHSDVEIPRGCCTFLFGLRAEWDYNWMDILQLQNNSDMQDVNLLFTAGVRF